MLATDASKAVAAAPDEEDERHGCGGQADTTPEGFPSGQREQTVNLPAYAFEGSNPSPSTNSAIDHRGNSSAGRASAFQAECHGFESRFPLQRRSAEGTRDPKAHLAQLVEHVLGKDEVISSILIVGSNTQAARGLR